MVRTLRIERVCLGLLVAAVAACSGSDQDVAPGTGDAGIDAGGELGSDAASATVDGSAIPDGSGGSDGAAGDARLDAPAEAMPAPTPTCAAPSKLPAFFTTFEDLAATTTPAIGVGTATLVGGTHVAAKCGMGIQLTGVESVKYPSYVGPTFNIRKASGAITFWYKATDDTKGGALFESGFSPLSFSASHGADGAVHFYVYLDVGKQVQAHTAASPSRFKDFVHLTFEWDFVNAGSLGIRVNGVSQAYRSVVLGGAVGGLGEITVGTDDVGRATNGVFDDFRIFL